MNISTCCMRSKFMHRHKSSQICEVILKFINLFLRGDVSSCPSFLWGRTFSSCLSLCSACCVKCVYQLSETEQSPSEWQVRWAQTSSPEGSSAGTLFRCCLDAVWRLLSWLQALAREADVKRVKGSLCPCLVSVHNTDLVYVYKTHRQQQRAHACLHTHQLILAHARLHTNTQESGCLSECTHIKHYL